MQKNRAQRLRRLTTSESARQLHALVQLGWSHRPRRAQLQPIGLAKLLRTKSAIAESIVARHGTRLDRTYLEQWAQSICDDAEDFRIWHRLQKLLPKRND